MKPLLLSLALALLSGVTCSAAIVMTAPVRYRSVLDSPYLAQHMAGTAILQNFENLDDECCENLILDRRGGELVNSPNPSGGGGFNASVDGDDGRLDGFAFPARGWSSTGDLNFPFMGFEILPLAGSGALPVWFGFAITHANPPNPPFVTTMEIIGENNVLLANLDLTALEVYVRSIPLDGLSNPVGNDVFVSWQSSEPIQQIRINGEHAIVIDHFQFGYTIPEPSSAAMLAVSFILAVRIRPRRMPRG